MSCLVDCWELTELGPPPNTIEFLPPPPLPAFLQRIPPIEALLEHVKGGNATSPCVEQLCDRWFLGTIGGASNVLGIDGRSSSGRGAVHTHPGGEYIDLPQQEWGGNGSPAIDGDVSDTWLLVLIGCSVGVLLLGAVLALFLLRCREVIMLAHRQHQTKASISHHHSGHIDHCATPGPQIKMPRATETVLYPTSHNLQTHGRQTDNRLLWAALTPRGGTQHFISESYPQAFMDKYGTPTETDNTYETIENYLPTVATAATLAAPVIQFKNNFKTKEYNLTTEIASFDNSGFVDYDYEDPTPLIESYQLNDIENHDTNPYAEVEIGNVHQINNSIGSLRRATQIRPRISSPTRIENPNLPPLNLHPRSGGSHRNSLSTNATLRRGTLSRRGSDLSNFSK